MDVPEEPKVYEGLAMQGTLPLTVSSRPSLTRREKLSRVREKKKNLTTGLTGSTGPCLREWKDSTSESHPIFCLIFPNPYELPTGSRGTSPSHIPSLRRT